MELYSMTKKEKEVLARLIELVKQYPEYDVVTMVDSEVVAGNEYDMWRGWLCGASIEEIVNGDESAHVRGIDDPEKIIYDFINTGEASSGIIESYENAVNYKEMKAILDELPWKTVILLQIST